MKICYKAFTILYIIIFTANVFAQKDERENGIALYEKENYAEAIESFQKKLEADKNDGELWRFLGMAYARTNDDGNARKAFKKAADFSDKELNKSYETPLKITSKAFAKSTKQSRRNGTTGTVKLAVEFSKDGKIGYIFPISKLPDGLTENAVKAAGNLKFEPPIRNGSPVTVIKFVEYSFMIM